MAVAVEVSCCDGFRESSGSIICEALKTAIAIPEQQTNRIGLIIGCNYVYLGVSVEIRDGYRTGRSTDILVVALKGAVTVTKEDAHRIRAKIATVLRYQIWDAVTIKIGDRDTQRRVRTIFLLVHLECSVTIAQQDAYASTSKVPTITGDNIYYTIAVEIGGRNADRPNTHIYPLGILESTVSVT